MTCDRIMHLRRNTHLEVLVLLAEAMREDGLIPGCPGYVGESVPPEARASQLGPDRADACTATTRPGLLTPNLGAGSA
ncbi:MAG: hypothetical protein IT537_08525 [Hyphomicrobiales bacterium]|nr:hypothetical protein [Hyphomicrobiales bacterium]